MACDFRAGAGRKPEWRDIHAPHSTEIWSLRLRRYPIRLDFLYRDGCRQFSVLGGRELPSTLDLVVAGVIVYYAACGVFAAPFIRRAVMKLTYEVHWTLFLITIIHRLNIYRATESAWSITNRCTAASFLCAENLPRGPAPVRSLHCSRLFKVLVVYALPAVYQNVALKDVSENLATTQSEKMRHFAAWPLCATEPASRNSNALASGKTASNNEPKRPR